MEIVIRSSEAVDISGVEGSDGPRRVLAGETTTLSGTDFSVKRVNPDELARDLSRPVTDDVRDPSNRPNGPMTAAIAPKMPKPMGELRQVPDGKGGFLERQVAERGVGEQAGGPDAPVASESATPGPKPQGAEATIDQTATATGVNDADGRPTARTVENVQAGPKKSSTKKSGTRRR